MYRCDVKLMDAPETVEDEIAASLGVPPSAPTAPRGGVLPQIPLSPLGADGLPAGLGMMPVGG